MDAKLQVATLRANHAALRLELAAIRLCLALRYNPYWHLQPRVPAGNPDGGQWIESGPLTAGPLSGGVQLAGPLPLLAIIARAAPAAYRALRLVTRRIAPLLRRLPDDWSGDQPEEGAFDEPSRRMGPPTPRRPEHEHVRFRTAEELRNYLGPAGPGRQWHHIVEARLAGRRFPAELIHSTDNVVNLPIEMHRQVSARMSSKTELTGRKTMREWLESRPFEEQYEFGLRLIRRVMREMDQ
jgi:hypothetical protein